MYGAETLPVLVSGADGFVGRALCARLAGEGWAVRRVVRRVADRTEHGEWFACGDIGPATDWSALVAGCDAVVHLANRAHVLHEHAGDPLAEFRRVNVEGTLGLARAALAAGLRRFVYVSSIGVHGSSSLTPLTEADAVHPVEAYALSKLEAERALQALLHASAMELVIVRPPLVYGPGCPGNFRRLLQLVARGWPLPLGMIDNRRSLIGIDNLSDLLLRCLQHPAAAGEILLAADGEDVSTPGLLRILGEGLGVPVRLWRWPPALLRRLAALAGRAATFDRLCGTLQVDAGKARRLLDWHPPVRTRDGLLACALAERRA